MEPQTNFHTPDLCGAFQAALASDPEPGDVATTEPWVRALLADAMTARASDIHLDSQLDEVRLRFRIDGIIQNIATFPSAVGLRLVRYFKVNSDLDPAPSRLPEDAHFRIDINGKPLDIRLACAPCIFGDKIALRLLQRSPVKLRLGQLGLRDEDRARIKRWLGDISGMFLVIGPVGSGKTTTLYTLLAEMHLDQRNVVTIEDPVEYVLPPLNQIEVDENRGLDFTQGLRSALRLDPDFLLLGEIRDPESAVTAMGAAGTGRVVLSTMHGRNAAGVITALRSFGLPNFQIAASLAFVVSQRLVRKLCPYCRKKEPPTDAERRWLESLGEKVPAQTWHAGGCSRCRQTGYCERTGLFEVLPVDESTYDLILAGQDEHGLRQHLRDAGFRPLLHDGLEKAAEGITDLKELSHSGVQSYLERSLRGD